MHTSPPPRCHLRVSLGCVHERLLVCNAHIMPLPTHGLGLLPPPACLRAAGTCSGTRLPSHLRYSSPAGCQLAASAAEPGAGRRHGGPRAVGVCVGSDPGSPSPNRREVGSRCAAVPGGSLDPTPPSFLPPQLLTAQVPPPPTAHRGSHSPFPPRKSPLACPGPGQRPSSPTCFAPQPSLPSQAQARQERRPSSSRPPPAPHSSRLGPAGAQCQLAPPSSAHPAPSPAAAAPRPWWGWPRPWAPPPFLPPLAPLVPAAVEQPPLGPQALPAPAAAPPLLLPLLLLVVRRAEGRMCGPTPGRRGWRGRAGACGCCWGVR